MIWLILLVLLMCAALVACVFEGAIRAEVYPPDAAGDPGLDCGCPESPVVIGCMVCSRTSCPAHQFHDHADPVDEVHDGRQRAKYFTGEEAAQLEATAQAPTVVAGSDLSDARVNLLFAVQVMPYAEDAKRYAAGLLGLYVVPEVER